MIKQIFKSVLFVVLISPLASLGMEPQPDRIELGKELVKTTKCGNWFNAKLLINQGADVNQKNKFGETPLMCAADCRAHEIVQMLIAAGADLNLQSDSGWTAFTIAGSWGDLVTCSMIIEEMIKQNKNQKERVYTFLTCLKRIPGFKNTNLARDLFKGILQSKIYDIWHEINRSSRVTVKNILLEKYGFQPISNLEPQ